MISIIILNYNGYEETNALANMLMKWDRDKLEFSVIIVDNCSTDNSYALLTKSFDNIPFFDVIKADRNGGYSYGNNYGAKYAIEKYHSEYLAISNPDVIFDQNTLIQLIDTFKLSPQIAMCAPIMKSVDGTFSIYSQRLPTYKDDLSACSLKNNSKTLLTRGYISLDTAENYIVTEMLPGSFFVIKSNCFIDIGMFDENVFLYCEERILGYRLKKAGYIAIKRADLSYIHAHAVTTSKAINLINRYKILFKSRLYYQEVYGGESRHHLVILRCAMRWYLIKLRLLLLFRRNVT